MKRTPMSAPNDQPDSPASKGEIKFEILDPQMVQVLRNLTPQQRLKTAFGMWESARILIRGTIRQQHPDWTEDQVCRETANRLSHGATERVPR